MENEELMIMSYPKSLLCIVGGAAAIAFGGDLTVDAASRIAIDFGMSQNLVGLTIVSIGTSLPELVTSIVAARKMKLIWRSGMRSVPISLTSLWYLESHLRSVHYS